MNKEQLIEKINSSTDLKEILHLRGQLINKMKEEIKQENDYSKKTRLEADLLNELQKHKDHISKMREEAKEKKYPLPEKVALKVKEIAATMELFLRKKDVLGRLKNGSVSAVISGVFTAAVSLGITALTGGAISLPVIAGVIPTACYMSLSSLISGLTNDTQKSKLFEMYEKAPEDAEKSLAFCKEFIIDNQTFIKASLDETKIEDLREKIKNEKVLIGEYQRLIDNAPIEQLKQVITLEMIDVMKNLDYNYSLLENRYLRNKESLTDEEYKTLTEEKNKLKTDILVKSSFFEETIKTTATNIGKRTAISYASRLALSAVFPSLAFTGVGDALTPFMYTLLGNVCTSGDIAKKIKMQKTNYTGTVIKLSHPELFEEERNKELATLQVA